jgi:hypothetical protein
MNLLRCKTFPDAVGRLATLLALFLFLQARAEEPTVPGRWLLVFDTSLTMKKCLPGTMAAVKNFFSTSADGQLRAGDSVAVWLVNQQINGQVPTFAAGATNTGTIVSNLMVFLQGQRYSKPSQLAVLQSPLNHVVAGSRRLTVILFTDGQSAIAGTPYDDGVNQTFHDVRAERQKDHEPVVVVIRSQLGKFSGCTLAFPPGDISFPPFPALPAPPVVAAPPKPVLPPPAPPSAPPLVIVGNQIIVNGGTNLNAESHPASSAPVVASNPPPVLETNPPAAVAAATNPPVPVPVMASNPPPVAPPVKAEAPPAPTPTSETKTAAAAALPVVPPVTPAATNPLAPVNPQAPATIVTQNLAKPSAPVAVTNAVVASTEPPSGQTRVFIFAGVGVVAAAGVITMILLVRSRRPQSSLISRSMENDLHRK